MVATTVLKILSSLVQKSKRVICVFGLISLFERMVDGCNGGGWWWMVVIVVVDGCNDW